MTAGSQPPGAEHPVLSFSLIVSSHPSTDVTDGGVRRVHPQALTATLQSHWGPILCPPLPETCSEDKSQHPQRSPQALPSLTPAPAITPLSQIH